MISPISQSRADVERFFSLPGRAHARDPLWVHPEYGIQRRLLRGTSAFRRRCDAAAWLIDDAAEAAAFRDPRYGDAGLIGLVESIPGQPRELASAYEAAERWLADRGARRVRVPVAGHVLYGFGFLAEGQDRPPVVGTIWSRPEDIAAARSLGYEVARRFLNYSLPLGDDAVRLARATPDPEGIRLERITRARFRRGILALAELRNQTFNLLFNDAPMHREEAWELLKRLRPVLVPGFALLAYEDERPVGMTLSFPDFNQAFAPVRREPRRAGGAFAMVRYRGRITRGALGEVGVLQSHRGRGIAAALVARVILAMKRRGYDELVYLLVQEDNAASRRTIERFGGRVVSSHVILEKAI